MSRQRWICAHCQEPVALALEFATRRHGGGTSEVLLCLSCLEDVGGYLMPANADPGWPHHVQVRRSDYQAPKPRGGILHALRLLLQVGAE